MEDLEAAASAYQWKAGPRKPQSSDTLPMHKLLQSKEGQYSTHSSLCLLKLLMPMKRHIISQTGLRSSIKKCTAVQGGHGSGSALQEASFRTPHFPRPEICAFPSPFQAFRGRPSSRGDGSTSARQKVRQGEVLHFRMRDAQAACSPVLYRLSAIGYLALSAPCTFSELLCMNVSRAQGLSCLVTASIVHANLGISGENLERRGKRAGWPRLPRFRGKVVA